MEIFNFLADPLGKLMKLIYQTIALQNYGLAIVLFSIITKAAMLPLTIKQFQSTARMQKLNPMLEDLRRQYGNDKQKLNEETMKLYQEQKINPMGGCLPLLITMPIMLSLYQVIIHPMRFLMEKTAEQIEAVTNLFRELSGSTAGIIQEMEIINFFKLNPDAMTRAEAGGLLAQSDLLNLSFLGLDLSRIPSYNPSVIFGPEMGVYLPLLLLALAGVAATYMSTRLSMAGTAASNSQNQQAKSMNRSMMLIGPIFTLIFSFQFPMGVLLYWDMGYIIQLVQQLFVNRFMYKVGFLGTKRPPQEELITAKAGSSGNAGAGGSGGSGGGAAGGTGAGGGGSGGFGGGAEGGTGSGAGGKAGGGGARSPGKAPGGSSKGAGVTGKSSGGSGKGYVGAGKAAVSDAGPKVTSINSVATREDKYNLHVGGGTFERDIRRFVAGADGGDPNNYGDIGDGSGSDGGAGGVGGDGSYVGDTDGDESGYSELREEDDARADALNERIRSLSGRSSASRSYGSKKAGKKKK